MCGICGIVGPSSANPDNVIVVKSMMDSLSHRGPDDEGFLKEENFLFGHRRLAIIDIEHGIQPMQSEDGNIVLIHNGEIYNYIELRQELIQKNLKFKTFSDTEVILRLYQEYGEDCVDKLNGMFAFAIYDKKNELFFAARDRFGIKPFYYYEFPDGSLIFASEIKAILQHPEIKSQLDISSLNQYLTFQFCLHDKTLFKGIQKLEPGHILRKKKNVSPMLLKNYWSLNYDIDIVHNEDYFIDRLLILLQNSIELQLRSDVPVGGYLSGGLDSSAIVALASAQNGKQFKTFTGKFIEGAEYDESNYARIVADNSNCEYFEAVPTVNDFISLLPKLIYHMDEPAAGPGLFPQYIVSKLAKKHVSVVLGGEGGDEIFGGYARYLVAYLEQCLKGTIFENQEEGNHVVTLESIIPYLSSLKQYVPMLKSFWKKGVFDSMDARYFQLINRSHELGNILSSDIRQCYNDGEIFSEFQQIFNHPKTKSYFNKMTHFDQQTLLPALLQVQDRMSMAVSLESRVPLLDHRIVELMAKIPPPIKLKGGKTKYILMKTMESFLPEKILERKDKMGFPVPLKEWMERPLKEFILDTLLSNACAERGIFNIEGLTEQIYKENKYGRQIWGALCLELWFCQFFDK